MGFPKTEIISLIWYLIPGFVAAWVFFGLTAYKKPSPFERVVQAFIFTAFILAVVFLIQILTIYLGDIIGKSFGSWTETSSLVVSVLVALLLGLLFSSLANSSVFHNFLSEKITKRTSFPCEWFSAFNNDKRFVYLHLDDERRLYGWASEWPEHPDEGHVILMKPEWILDDNRRAPLHLTQRMLIPAKKVVMVEFEKYKNEWEHTSEQLEESERRLLELRLNQNGGRSEDE